MANYYTLFSGLIEHLANEEVAWLRRQLQYVYVLDGELYTEDELPRNESSAEGYRIYLEASKVGIVSQDDFDPYESPEVLGFMYAITDDGPNRKLWIYSEDDGGDIDKVGMLVADFLQEFRPNELWTLTWASTCSSPRVDAFGGGCLFAVAGEFDCISTWSPRRPRMKIWDAIVQANSWVIAEWGRQD